MSETIWNEASSAAAEEAASKRYETLVTIKTRAINGKGAWYWAHLEPILTTTDSGLPKAAKIRCSLCEAVFSASNPSRTASEHLKRGSCPNFTALPSSSSSSPKPISSAPPLPSAPVSPLGLTRKRPIKPTIRPHSIPPPPLLLAGPPLLSGGKDDLGALAMLEDSVKRLKNPNTVPGPTLPKQQSDAAIALLSDWLLESTGHLRCSSLLHPKFRDFLHQLGLPPLSPRSLFGPLDSRHCNAVADSDARLRDALFFQLASGGWKRRGFVGVAANLPNGGAVFRRTVLAVAHAPSDYAEELLSDCVDEASPGIPERCVGIVADRFKTRALRNLELENRWMVNLSCQVQGILSLVKDFARDLPLFDSAACNCLKLANFFNGNSRARVIFHKYQLQQFDQSFLLHVPDNIRNFETVFSMLEDVMHYVHPLRASIKDMDYKVTCLEDPTAREVGKMVQDVGFWNELEAVRSLVKLIKDTAREVETERALVGQCLPLWNELKSKVKDWCVRFEMDVTTVEKVIDRRFKKNYHPAWSAAFILDPVHLIKDVGGKYVPPFKLLTPEQEKDVSMLITRLVSRDEAHVVLMELMKWRSDGLDPLYAKAVQVKQPDPVTGKMRIANPQSSRLVWETCLSELKLLGKVAVRIIFLHATASCGLDPNLPLLRWVGDHGRSSRTALDRAQKMVFVAAHAKLGRSDFSTGEEMDAELFDEPFVDAPSV